MTKQNKSFTFAIPCCATITTFGAKKIKEREISVNKNEVGNIAETLKRLKKLVKIKQAYYKTGT